MFWAMTGEHPPDALSRLRMDNVDKMLNARRSRFSAPFIAAIQWGLTVEETRRPQSVDNWRSAVLRGTPIPGGAKSESNARPDDTRKYVWMALGVLIFFLFVAGNDILKERAAQQRGLRFQLEDRPVTGGGAPRGRSAPGGAVHTPPAGLSRDEFVRSIPHLADKFSEIDTDRNGLVTTEELQNYLRRDVPDAGK
jgi:hypothetical protein